MNTPVSGTPRQLLRLEAAAVLIASVIGYRALGGSWWVFALLLLVPDVSFAGYTMGPRVGAVVYNTFHSYLAPAVLATVAYAADIPRAWPLALIWTAHIGMDRALGYGLKFASAFRDTHLGPIGRNTPSTP